MNLRTIVISAALSLFPLGQPLVIGTGTALTTTAVILSIPEEAKAESAEFYFNRGVDKYFAGDYYGASSDYNKAIEINPKYAPVYIHHGAVKALIGDMKGACSDWRKASELGDKNTAKWVRDQC